MLFDDLKDKKLLKDIFTYNLNLILLFCSFFTLYIIIGITVYHLDKTFINHATVALILFLGIVLAGILIQRYRKDHLSYYEMVFAAYYVVTLFCIYIFSSGDYHAIPFVYFGVLTLLFFSMLLYIPFVFNVIIMVSITLTSIIALSNMHAPVSLMATLVITMLGAMVGSSRIMKQFIKIRQYREHIIRQEKVIAEMTDRDALTDLYNNKYISKHLSMEIQRANRYHTPLCLMIIDIDNFRKINLQYGQVTGDETLTTISNMLMTICRNTDIVGRFSGEEFVIVLPNTSLDESIILAERIRITINKNDFNFNYNISVSIGLAEYLTHTPTELISEAENNVKLAKSEGRNRVSIGG